MKMTPTPAAFLLVVLLTLFYPILAAAAAAAAASVDSPAPGMRLGSVHLTLNTKPPETCAAPLYGTIIAHSPDGALCLCHQGYAGKQGFWEQIGTALPCWPDKK
jgi:hypothetical protein